MFNKSLTTITLIIIFIAASAIVTANDQSKGKDGAGCQGLANATSKSDGNTAVSEQYAAHNCVPKEQAPEQATEQVTQQPIEQPTEQATQQPTEQPTEQATEQPTEQPTEQATDTPTEQPTEQATEQPTEQATEQPTEQATDTPTEQPTEQATDTPTEQPTEQATDTPTASLDSDGDGFFDSMDCEPLNADIYPGSSIGCDSVGETVLGTGALQITLVWDSISNLNLKVAEPPYGEEISWLHPISGSGGTLEQNVECGGPLYVENIYWADTAPNGDYIIQIDEASLCGSARSANWILTIRKDGQKIGQYQGSGSAEIIFSY